MTEGFRSLIGRGGSHELRHGFSKLNRMLGQFLWNDLEGMRSVRGGGGRHSLGPPVCIGTLGRIRSTFQAKRGSHFALRNRLKRGQRERDAQLAFDRFSELGCRSSLLR